MDVVAERVEVVAEQVVVEPRPAVDDEQRQPVAAALDDMDPGVGDLDVTAHASTCTDGVPRATRKRARVKEVARGWSTVRGDLYWTSSSLGRASSTP